MVKVRVLPNTRLKLAAAFRYLPTPPASPSGSCTVHADRGTQPGSDTELVTVTCGNHSVAISVGSVGQELVDGIDEMWKSAK
jgi:hypothetical protein